MSTSLGSNRLRSFALLASLGALVLAFAGCKQDLGERCEQGDDCASGYCGGVTSGAVSAEGMKCTPGPTAIVIDAGTAGAGGDQGGAGGSGGQGGQGQTDAAVDGSDGAVHEGGSEAGASEVGSDVSSDASDASASETSTDASSDTASGDTASG